MDIRKKTEEFERQSLHRMACLSMRSQGRARPEKDEGIRTCFQRDRDRIIHSKAFRRLKHKTQVFLAPKGDHYRTRLTHALEVSQIARTISRALRLNEDLTEAISLGHDLGHTPFGHAGEAVLKEIHPGGFEHHEQSLRVVDVLEKNGRGLNLTQEVRNGIVKHSKGKGSIIPAAPREHGETLESLVVRISDVIAYVNHDLDDALRASIIKKGDIPPAILKVLGDSSSKRINALVKSLVYKSLEEDLARLVMDDETSQAVELLRAFLLERVYNSPQIIDEFKKAKNIVKSLYSYYLEDSTLFARIPHFYSLYPNEETIDKHRVVCDFIAGMTDHFAIMTYERVFVPQQWTVL